MKENSHKGGFPQPPDNMLTLRDKALETLWLALDKGNAAVALRILKADGQPLEDQLTCRCPIPEHLMLANVSPFLLRLLADMVIKSEHWDYELPKELKDVSKKWRRHRKVEENQDKAGRVRTQARVGRKS